MSERRWRGANVGPLETLNRLQARLEGSGVDRFISHHLSLYGRFCNINVELAPKNTFLRLAYNYSSHLLLFKEGLNSESEI